MIRRELALWVAGGIVAGLLALAGLQRLAERDLNRRIERCAKLEQIQGPLAVVRDADCVDALRTRALERKGRK
ncbi:MAG: hypothetical protein ACREUT_15535 [Steroidobacteraceae bacterium]